MKQGRNKLHIEGKLLEKKIVQEGTGKAGKWVKAEFTIRDGIGAEIPVTFMQSEIVAKTGEENKAYKGLMTALKDYKSIAEVGEEEADLVRVSTGSIKKNVYKKKDGQLAEITYFEGRYISRIKDGEEIEPSARLVVSGIIHKIIPQKEDTELLIRMLIPNYSGMLEYFDFKVNKPEAVEFFTENVEVGQSFEFDVDVNYKTQKEKKLIKRSFGGDKVEETFTRLRDLVITSGSELYGENEWDADEVATGVKELQKRYEDILNAEVKKTTPSTQKLNTKKEGFNKAPVESGDIPF